MMKYIHYIALMMLLTSTQAVADLPQDKVAEAAENAHAVLTRMSDDFGGRLTGSESNEAALDRLTEELRALGLDPVRDDFSMPGWERGDDKITIVAPFHRVMRTAAMGYSPACRKFQGKVVDIGRGGENDWPDKIEAGAIGLVSPGARLSTAELAKSAAKHRLAALLLINRVAGGQLLMRTGSYVGEPLPIPAFTITVEEGRWIQRLLARGINVSLELESTSQPRKVETSNLIVRIPGKSSERVIIGAHFDSWDLGQGAIDNGLGVAQMFAVAQILREQELSRTVEIVWLNGEEQGLWGSRHAAGNLGETPVVAMVNLDMVGVPLAVNALGADSLVPFLEAWNQSRGEEQLPEGVLNKNWLGGDHVAYQMAGVPAVTFHAPIKRESVRYYHDFSDTMDKLPKSLLQDSVSVIADLVLALAQDDTLKPTRLSPAEIKDFFERDGLDKRLRRMGWWQFE